ncbi:MULTISPECIES: FtsX-like permease family protein [unclassified Clostridium]|uniref:ABC transporter permease n=1 Tax=unclassified Clostridium TaxID=2614128 RepID=UPI0002978BE2|nr:MULTISPECIES: FtsX-like permease family protein [unclassified Clostridium]EKQ58069.1 MAG: ABC-type transport system, involved in lipoprotein release, permease component [Clostridium sp. Maddingley MBC34-26]
MVLNKRILREFRENIGKYLGLIILVLISSMLIVGFSDSTDCIIATGEKAALENNLEDGEFYVSSPLNSMTLEKIRELGVNIEENFYVDYKLYENQTIRIFKDRKNINRISITQGNKISETNQIIIDEHFGEVNNFKLSSNLIINKKNFNVVGYGAAPDYTNILQKSGDVISNPKTFGIGFISEEDFRNLKNKSYSYVFKLNGISADKVKNIVSKNSTMREFVKISDNTRAIGYINDSKTNKNVSIIIGCVLCIMIGFMISMSLINSIDQESPIIGALYSLGYIKKEILNHFMILPIIVVSIGSIIGTCLGFDIEDAIGKATSDTYVLPNIKRIYPPYLIFIGVVIPIVIVVFINYFIISKKLNSTPLQLLRREKKANKLNTIKINSFGFITKFRLREFFREIRGNIILFSGIFMSTFLLVFGVAINSAINEYVKNVKEETTYNYMYTLKFPIEITENKGLEKSTFKNLSIYYKDLGLDMDVVLQGINEKSNFYSFSINDDDPGVYISDSAKDKFNLNVGDNIILKDKSENKVYNLKIKGIVDYKLGLNLFMNRVQLNELLREDKSYFNGYLSKKPLDINNDYIYSETTAQNLIKSAESMTSMMLPIVIVLIVFSSILFIISMYLLLKLMIDKSLQSISLIKIFGFNQGEINKLYLGSSLYTVAFSTVISIPLALKITKLIYPNLIANVQAYFSIVLEPQDYCFIIVLILFSYFISNMLLRRHINKISLSEALKNRD